MNRRNFIKTSALAVSTATLAASGIAAGVDGLEVLSRDPDAIRELSGFRFDGIYIQHFKSPSPERPDAVGFCVNFRDNKNRRKRQAVIISKDETIQDFGKHLEELGRFFQNPDSRMNDGSTTLAEVNELNRSEYPVHKAEEDDFYDFYDLQARKI